jgi:hypothetical protein
VICRELLAKSERAVAAGAGDDARQEDQQVTRSVLTRVHVFWALLDDAIIKILRHEWCFSAVTQPCHHF